MIRSGIFVTIVLLFATIVEPANSSGNTHSVSLSPVALDYARKLIRQDHVVNDKRGEWAEHQASATDESEFMTQRGSEEYARWYLGIDESHRPDSKARYKFPFGDFKNVHRCALIAVRNRARQYGYADIERAATELLSLIPEQKE